MKEEDIKIGVKITFPENKFTTSDDKCAHVVNIGTPFLTYSNNNKNIVFEVIYVRGKEVCLRVIGSDRDGDMVFGTKTAIKQLGTEAVEDKVEKHVVRDVTLLTNYKIHIDKNGYRSSDKIETIEDIRLDRLTHKECYDRLCKDRVCVRVYNEGSFYEEYDEFYFQAENTEKALSVGMYLYHNQEKLKLPEMNKYSLTLFIEGQYDYDAMLKTNKTEAYIQWVDYLYEQNKTIIKEQEPLKVWRFDTVGPCVYGEAIVVAKNDIEALHTFTAYAQNEDIGMLKKKFQFRPYRRRGAKYPFEGSESYLCMV